MNNRNAVMRIKKFFSRIQNKLLIFSLAVLLGASGLVAAVYHITLQIMRNNQGQIMLTASKELAAELDAYMVDVENGMALLSVDQTLHSILLQTSEDARNNYPANLQTVRQLVRTYLGEIYGISSVEIYGKNGSIYELQDTISSGTLASVQNQHWFLPLAESKKNTILMPSHPDTGKLYWGEPPTVITLAGAIHAGGVEGYLVVDIRTDALGTHIDAAQKSFPSHLLLLENGRTVFYKTDPSTQLDTSLLLKIHPTHQGYLLAKQGNHSILAAYVHLPKYSWTVLQTLPVTAADAKLSSLKFFLLFTIAFLMPLLLVVAFLISRTISQSVLRLQTYMRRVEDGDLDVKIKIDSQDEIGDLGIHFSQMLEKIRLLIGEVYQKELSQKAAELNALQAQINPHFLYNTLQIMDIMAEEKEAYDISDACQALSNVFRYSIRRNEIVTLQDEIEHVKNYMHIQKLRFGDRLKIHYDLDPDTIYTEMIKLLLQPIVENAIIHGIEGHDNQCEIFIRSYQTHNTLSIVVEDTGAGMSSEKLAKIREDLKRDQPELTVPNRPYGGIAMRNVQQRIKLRYGGTYGLYILSEKNKGTKVIINLPAQRTENTI